MKIKYLTIFTFTGILFLTSCCRDCLITNRELSSIKTIIDKDNNKILKINSAWKSVEIQLTDNEGIKAYSIENNNILSGLYPGLIDTTYIFDKSNSKQQIKFIPVENKISGSNTAELTNKSINKALNIVSIRKYIMNLDNGNLYISEEVVNNSNTPQKIIQDDKFKLKNGGYLLLPLSILTNLNNHGWEFTGKNSERFINNKIIKSGNFLILHAISGIEVKADPNSGWFAYFKDGMLFIKKFNNENSVGKRVNKIVKITVDSNSLDILQPGEEKSIPVENSIIEKQRWSIVPIEEKVNSLDEAVVFFNKIDFNLRLLINRK